MRKIFIRYKKIVGILMLIVSVLFFVFWETVGRKEFMYEEIVVFNCDVSRGTIVEPHMISSMRISTENIAEGALRTCNSILGLEAKQTIPSGFPLSESFFSQPVFVLDDDEKIMKLPQQWIYSVPETLRRGDSIYIYAIKTDNDTNTVQNSPEGKQFIFNTTVAYVKDNSNHEVESIDGDRLSGTSSVNHVEIIITEKEFTRLERYISMGYVFVLMYKL